MTGCTALMLLLAGGHPLKWQSQLGICPNLHLL